MATEVDQQEVKLDAPSQGLPDGQGAAIETKSDMVTKVTENEIINQEQTSDDNHNNGDSNNNGGDGEDGEMHQSDSDKQGSMQNTNESMDESEKTNLIVNYLPQQMTDEQFENLFKKYGPMKSCKIVRNKNTGYSYGFGFADYETHEQALKAIEELNGHEVDTKKIKVAFARPAGQDIKQANLYVKGVPNSWSQDDVKKVFEPYGQIIQVRVLGNDRGIAFVLFDLRRQAEEAMEALNGKQVEGCEVPFEIKFAADKKSEKRGNRQGTHNRGGRRNHDRGNRGGVGRSLSNNRNNNNNSNQRRGTSQQGRSNRGMFNKQGMNNNNNSNNNNNYNDQMNGGGVGPMRQQQGNRMSRYAPFPPMQQAPMQPATAPGMIPTPYGYQPQAMMGYMMPSQMMQMSQMGHHQQQQQPQQMPMAGHPMNQYAQMGYAQQAALAQPATAMSNMYNMASSTLNNAAQMQPQLGQPMNTRAAPSISGGVGASVGVSVGGGMGIGVGSGGNGGMQQGGNGGSDGITLFVYNIGPNSDESELKSMFAPYGDVLRSNVVRKTPGGETKGFGFVTVRTRDQAGAAIAALNGQIRNGKTLQVSLKK